MSLTGAARASAAFLLRCERDNALLKASGGSGLALPPSAAYVAAKTQLVKSLLASRNPFANVILVMHAFPGLSVDALDSWRTAFIEGLCGGSSRVFPEGAWLSSALATKARNPCTLLRDLVVDLAWWEIGHVTREACVEAAGEPGGEWHDRALVHVFGASFVNEGWKHNIMVLGDILGQLQHPAHGVLASQAMALCMGALPAAAAQWRLRALGALIQARCSWDAVREDSPEGAVLCSAFPSFGYVVDEMLAAGDPAAMVPAPLLGSAGTGGSGASEPGPGPAALP